MPVPSSYNDITQKISVRDHVGWVWYEREFWIPKGWQKNHKIFIRFGGVNYRAIVVNTNTSFITLVSYF